MKIKNFTAQQIEWASQHDWFCFANENAIYTWEICSRKDAEMSKHTNFQALREWAGY